MKAPPDPGVQTSVHPVLTPMKNPLRLLLLPILLFGAAIAGCGGGGVSRAPLPPTAELVVTAGGTKVAQPGWTVRINPDVQPRKKWTVLVYMNGANDLETYGILNMNQMEQIGSTDGVNLAVQYKRYAGRFDSTNDDWGDTRRFYVTRGTNNQIIESNLVSQRENVDMGKVATLQEFIDWGVKTFPADHYCLVLWNHGAGWRKVKVTRGISYDDVTGNHIDTIDMPEAIRHPDGTPWDALFLDLSLMQMVEVAYEIRATARFILGSQESPPGEGLPYDLWVKRLVQNPDISGRDLAIGTINDTIERFGNGSNTTQSVLDTTKLAAIAPELDGLGAALMAVKNTQGEGISDARAEAESYAYPENKDLIDFLDRMKDTVGGSMRVPDPNVQQWSTRVRIAVNAAIVANVRGTQHPRSNGLAAFLPTPIQFSRTDIEQANGFGQRYQALALAKAAPNWLTFLANGPR